MFTKELVAECPKCYTRCHYPIVLTSLHANLKCWPAHCVNCKAPFIIIVDPVRCIACNPSNDNTCRRRDRRVLAIENDDK